MIHIICYYKVIRTMFLVPQLYIDSIHFSIKQIYNIIATFFDI